MSAVISPRRFADSVSTAAYNDAINAYRAAGALAKSAGARWRTARARLAKHAGFGSNQAPQFEQAFGSIAFTYLQEKAPGIVPHIIGFQLLDRTDDGEKSVGAFVAQIGNRIIDVPMFFDSGELKGHHIMRLRSPDLFIPLREAFLDYLLSKMPQDLGEPGPGVNSRDPARSSPNIRPFDGSRYTKAAADHLKPWAVEYKLAEAYAEMTMSAQTLIPAVAMKRKEAGSHIDLLGFLCENPQLLKSAAVLCDNYPQFNKRMTRLMGDQWLKTAAEKAVTSRRHKLLPAPRRPLGLKLGSAKQASEALRIHVKMPTVGVTDGLREEMAKYGEFVEDRRPMEKLSKLYEVEDYSATIMSPDEPGTYDVMDGDEKRRAMVVYPSSCRVQGGNYDLIIDTKAKRVATVETNDYVVYGQTSTELDATKPPKDVLKSNKNRPSEGDLFLVLGDDNRVAGPFGVTKRISNNRFEVSDMTTAFDNAVVDDGPPTYPSPISDRINSVRDLLFADDGPSKAITQRGRTLIVPKTTKVYVFGNHTEEYMDGLEYVSTKAENKFQLSLFSRDHFKVQNIGKHANLQVRVKSAEVEINGQSIPPWQARRRLLSYGIGKEAAEQVLTGPPTLKSYLMVQPGREISSLTELRKLAYYTPQIDVPEFREPYDSESGRYQIEEQEQLTAQAEPVPYREELMPWEEPEGAGGYNDGAMQSDMQNVMDRDGQGIMDDMVGLISIIRNGRIDSSVRQTTKSLLQTIDKLGRQLLGFYAHEDEYAEQYGESEMEDLEAAMITTFESNGDLFITLQRRSADPSPELDVANLPT